APVGHEPVGPHHVMRILGTCRRDYPLEDNLSCFLDRELSDLDEVREVRLEEGQKAEAGRIRVEHRTSDWRDELKLTDENLEKPNAVGVIREPLLAGAETSTRRPHLARPEHRAHERIKHGELLLEPELRSERSDLLPECAEAVVAPLVNQRLKPLLELGPRQRPRYATTPPPGECRVLEQRPRYRTHVQTGWKRKVTFNGRRPRPRSQYECWQPG